MVWRSCSLRYCNSWTSLHMIWSVHENWLWTLMIGFALIAGQSIIYDNRFIPSLLCNFFYLPMTDRWIRWLKLLPPVTFVLSMQYCSRIKLSYMYASSFKCKYLSAQNIQTVLHSTALVHLANLEEQKVIQLVKRAMAEVWNELSDWACLMAFERELFVLKRGGGGGGGFAAAVFIRVGLSAVSTILCVYYR